MNPETKLEQNLYNRLKPEFAKQLDAIATKYPDTARLLRRELKANRLYFRVTFDVAESFRTFLGVPLDEFKHCFEDINHDAE